MTLVDEALSKICEIGTVGAMKWLYEAAVLVAAHEREKQSEQEPVAEVVVRPLRGDQSQPTTDIKWLQRQTTGKLYAAPVRTKYLTDDEIEEIGKSYFDEWSFGFARAVIAADREKNRG